MVRHGTTWTNNIRKQMLFDSIIQSYESFRPDSSLKIEKNDVVNMVSSLAGMLWKSEDNQVKERYRKLAQEAEITYKQKVGLPLHMIHYDSERAASKSTLNTIKLEEPNCGSPAVINPSNNLNNSISVQITPISESHVPINVNYDNSNNHSEFQQNFYSDTNLEGINYSKKLLIIGIMHFILNSTNDPSTITETVHPNTNDTMKASHNGSNQLDLTIPDEISN
ncbi:4761_t:CDS:2 [Entrophospora sp. SA101]|nr:4761_t:CDS:2 [Entrophospora sp. SA101]